MKRNKLFITLFVASLIFMFSSCGNTNVHVHKYGSWTFITEPTLYEGGTARRVCECGEIDEQQVPSLSNTSLWTYTYQEPTCADAGGDIYTSHFGKIVYPGQLLEHEMNDGQITVVPGLESTGLFVKNCLNCNHEVSTVVPKLSDITVWSLVEEASTCTKEGKKTFTSIFGEVVLTIEKLAHNYDNYNIVVEPTLTSKGSANATCTACSHEGTVEVPALSDNVWTLTTVESTCAVNGSDTYTSVYGTIVHTLEKLPHTYGKWTFETEPTEETSGSVSKLCHCGDKVSQEVAALSDTSVWEVTSIEVSYNEKGIKTYLSEFGEVSIEVAKLVAPYDNKTYSSMAFDARNSLDEMKYEFGVLTPETAWKNATVTFGNVAIADGVAFPFRGQNKLVMVDPNTGKMNFIQTSYKTVQITEPIEDEDWGVLQPGESITVLDPTSAITYVAYVDFESGIIVKAHGSSFNYVMLCTPFEVGASEESFKASSWNDAMAIQYSYDGTTYSIFVYNEVVYFGVTYKDAQGNVLTADECVSADYVYVTDKNGSQIAGFSKSATNLEPVDGLEGTYTNGVDTAVLNGIGNIVLNSKVGTYTVEENFVGAMVDGVYYEITLDQENDSLVVTKPMVTITYDTLGVGSLENDTVNKNVPYALQTPEDELNAFKGWFYDAELLQPVEVPFIPTESLTLYASWKPLVIINLVGVLESDVNQLKLGEGDVIGNFLPTYNIDLGTWKIFKGWFLDSTFETTLPEAAVVSPEDTNLSIYAKWDALPAYYGTYYGGEIWNERYGNTGGKQLVIDENGNMSGLKTGIITSYDSETQLVTWKSSATSSTIYKFYFDEEAGIIAGIYDNNYISNDFYLLSRVKQSESVPGKFAAAYGVYTVKPTGGTTKNYYAQFSTVKTELGDINILCYYDHIYSDITITNSLGVELAVTDIKLSQTVVVTDNTTGSRIIALAATGDSFSATPSKTIELDDFYGVYTNGEQTIVLDGVGAITYGELSGTYTVSSSEAYQFDVYLSDNTEYYRLTLNGDSFEMTKPMVEVTFEVGEHTPIASQSYNINVAATLPNGDDEGYVFNGYYFDQEFSRPVPVVFVPIESVVLYAKYSSPATMTVVYNDEITDNLVTVYSVNDVVNVQKPVYAKHKFLGWFTTPTFEAETEWTSGSVIVENTTIYAKWEVAPVYNNYYIAVEISGKNLSGTSSLYTRTSGPLDIDPDGFAKKSGYPFGYGDTRVTNFDAEEGTIELTCGTTVYYGYIDVISGIIVIPYSANDAVPFGQIMLLTPFEQKPNTANFSSSYWNNGLTRVVEYTFGGETYRLFINNNKVFMNVTFTDDLGADVLGIEAYQSSVLIVKDSSNNQIAKFGYDGTTMVELDGFEGTYSDGTNELVLNGVDKVTFLGNTGTYNAAPSEAAHTHDVFMNEGGTTVYYQLTVNLDTMTYTINKPMVTLSFNGLGKVEIESVTVNVNVAYNLPSPTAEGYVFRNWYLNEELTQVVSQSFIPQTTCTLYAKWDELRTLTVVYGNGLETETLYYGVGDTVQPTEPGFTDGRVFDGWFLDQTFTTPYVLGSITENLTIYCRWLDSVASYGEYVGWNLYGLNGKTTSNFPKTLTITPAGAVSGTRTGTVEGTTGVIYVGQNYFYFEPTLEILYTSYSANKSNCGTDTYVFFKKGTYKTIQSFTFSNSGNYISLVTFEKEDNSLTYVLFKDSMVYPNVVVKDTSDVLFEGKANTLTSSNKVVIYATDGSTILYQN